MHSSGAVSKRQHVLSSNCYKYYSWSSIFIVLTSFIYKNYNVTPAARLKYSRLENTPNVHVHTIDVLLLYLDQCLSYDV